MPWRDAPTLLPAAALAEWHRVGVVAGDSTSGLGLDAHSVVAMDWWTRRWQASGIPWNDMKLDLVVGFEPLAEQIPAPHPAHSRRDHLHIDPATASCRP